jgi:hypothetical protein
MVINRNSREWSDAFLYGVKAGVRTTAQTAAGLVAVVTVVQVSDIKGAGLNLAVAGVASLLAGLAAFLQNFAEQLA